MSAWRKFATLGLLVSVFAYGCTVEEGDDDLDGTGGRQDSGGSGGVTGGSGGTGGATGGTGGATGGAGGATGGAAGASGGSGGMEPICEPDSTDVCVQCLGTTCCTEFEECTADEFCQSNAAYPTSDQCVDSCKQAICTNNKAATCNEADLANTEYLSAEAAQACANNCSPSLGGTVYPANGEFECALRCMQAATSQIGALIGDTSSICAGGCKANDASGTIAPATAALIGCIAPELDGENTPPNCREQCVEPLVQE